MSKDGEKKTEKRAMPEISEERKAIMERSKESINIFVKNITFLMMHQVGIVQNGDIDVIIHIKESEIVGFDFKLGGKMTYKHKDIPDA